MSALSGAIAPRGRSVTADSALEPLFSSPVWSLYSADPHASALPLALFGRIPVSIARSRTFANLLRRPWVRGISVVTSAALMFGTVSVIDTASSHAATSSAAVDSGSLTAPDEASWHAATSSAAVDGGTLTAPDEASARVTAQLRNREVLIEDATTETTRSWALPNGSTRTEVAAAPVRVQRNGRWVDVDSRLVAGVQDVHTAATTATVSFSKGGDAALARVTSLIPSRDAAAKAGGAAAKAAAPAPLANPAVVGLDWKGTLPKPVLSGNKATYPNVLPNTDLTMEALGQGFAQRLTVKVKPSAPMAVRLPLKLKNLTLQVGPGGQLRLVDGKGRLRAQAPAPVMWDSRRDPMSGLPLREVPVKVAVEGTPGAQTLVLRPDAAFLADPATQYPVTIDPTTTLTVSADVTVQTDKPTSQSGTVDLQAGTYNAGSVQARSLLKFDVASLKGKKINAADLSLYEIWSSSCTPTPVEVRRVTANWDPATALWTNQPTLAGTPIDTVTEAHGFNSTCPAAYRHFKAAGMAKLVQEWADGTVPNYGLALRATNETDSLSWKRWNSANYGGTAVPRLAVTYNSYPYIGTGRSVIPCHSGCDPSKSAIPTNAQRPILTAHTRDPDGGNLRHSFEIWAGHDATPTTMVTSGTTDFEASGTRVTWSPSVDLAPGQYSYRVRAYDGQLYGPWSSTWYKFTVDTTPPPAPAVSALVYKNDGQWYGAAGTKDTFTLTPVGADTATLTWSLDEGPDTVVTTGTATTISLAPPTDGPHVLRVQARDRAGNSAITRYAFNVGVGAISSPAQGDRTARRFVLGVATRGSATGATFQYRRGAADAWKTIPAAHVQRSDGTAVTWPVATTVAGATASVDNLRWDAVATLGGEGAVDVQAVFTGVAGATRPVTAVVDVASSGAESAEMGPGEVNLLTGNYTLTRADGDVFDLSVSRTATSRDPEAGEKVAGLVAPFGPEWAVGGVGEAENAYQAVRYTSATSVQVLLQDATWIEFVKSSGAGATTAWRPQPGSEELKLTGDGTAAAPFVLTDNHGGVTRFKGGPDPVHVVETMTPASSGSVNATRYGFEAVPVAGGSKLRLRRMIAPTSALPDTAVCDVAAPPTGCRVVELVYTPETAAKPAAGAVGSFPGRVDSLQVWATAPGGTGTVKTVVTKYAYDDTGRLRDAYDPRVSGVKESYAYDAAGRVTSLTPAGQLPWRFEYANLNLHGDTNAGRLTRVRRATLTPGSADVVDGDAVQSVVYGVPVSGPGSPRDMSESRTAAWGQTGRNVPSDATAVFTADYVPATSVGGAGANLSRSTITYLDPNGRTTNTATPGSSMDYTAYDSYGQPVQQLTARNRSLALAPANDTVLVQLGLQGESTANRAQQLSTVSVYSANGIRSLHNYGPLHMTQVPGQADPVPARTHTENVYDEGRPATGALVSDLVTTTRTGAHRADAAADVDVRATKTEYDWKLAVATKEIKDPGTGKLNVTSVTGYDGQGRVVRVSQPKSSGTDAGTTLTRYYTAGANADAPACGNKPAWADLICQVGPAGAIAGSPAGQPK